MRFWLFILAVLATTICIEKPVRAQNYPWCAYYDVWQGATNCGFSTFQQCMATVSGVGGSCGPNPLYQAAPGPYPSHSRRYHH
jgi:Protein of unknown function (DUF3551)